MISKAIRLPSIHGGQANSLGDHRLAMAWAIAGMLSKEGISVEDMEAADVSYPDFLDVIKKVAR